MFGWLRRLASPSVTPVAAPPSDRAPADKPKSPPSLITNAPVPEGGPVSTRRGGVLSAFDDARNGLSKPDRAAFDDDASFDAAFLGYQDARMAELRKAHPHARVNASIWHGTDTPPEEVLAHGLPAKPGDCYDLAKHQLDFTDRSRPEESSALRGGCSDCRIPGLMAGEGGWVYLIAPRGGAISLGDALREKDFLPEETEISFGARQPPDRILGWRQVGRYSDLHGAHRIGEFVENPDYKADE